MMGSKHASCKRPRVSRTARLSCACIVLLLWGTFLVDVVQATPPPEVCWPSMSGEVMQAACMAVCMAAYWRLRRHRRQQRGVDDDDDGGDAPLLPQGGRGGQRPRKGRGTARRHWLKGLDAWRLRSEENPSAYEREYLNTVQHWSEDRECPLYREFRRKFRVPYELFCDIMDEAHASGIWADKTSRGKRKRGAPPTPLALKVLAALRVLALGCPVDGVVLESGVSQPVLQRFIHRFMQFMVDTFYSRHVRMHDSVAEMDVCEAVYSCLGLPGCVGSMDGVHLAWDNCPSPFLPLYKGKEGFPTLAYNVTVDHTKRVLAVHGAYPGARNDKTIARTDPAVRAVRFHPMYQEYTFNMFNSMGQQMKMSGATF